MKEKNETVYDCTGKEIHKGDLVKWYDPALNYWSKVTYTVYTDPREEMLHLWSPYGECEAFPSECKIIDNHKTE